MLRLTHKENGKVVSSLWIYIVELPSRKLAVIEEVFTLEEYRGRGYATELIKQAIQRAKDEKCDCVELNCREDKMDFYQKFGFFDRNNKSLRLVL